MVVREYRASDIPRIARLYENTIRTVNAKDYQPEQIETWAAAVGSEEDWTQRLEEKYFVFVAEFEDMTTGFAEFEESGHIDCFYVHHDWQRRGVGSQLLHRIEEEAVEELKLDRIDVEASITARPFFSVMGFEVVREEVQTFKGVPFPTAFMVKELAGS